MNDFRPQYLKDVVGNELNNRLLLSIARSDNPPNVYIFAGDYGCGKTTCSRIFSKAVNCEHLTDDICGKCESCKLSIDNNPLYTEYDSSMCNRVGSIREMYDELTFSPKGKRRVITFDEFHLTTREAQSALLKLFEDSPKNIFYILCTTDKSAIIPTIISRALTLNFTTKSKEEVIDNIKSIALKYNINLPDNIASLIALRSKGHMRDAHKLLEKYMLIGESDFISLEESGYTYLAKYFANVLWLIKNSRASADDIKKHKMAMIEISDKLMHIPIALLKDDYQSLFFDLAKKCFDEDYKTEPIIEAIVKSYDKRSIMNLYKVSLDDFTINSFESDIRFQTALLSIYQRLLLGV